MFELKVFDFRACGALSLLVQVTVVPFLTVKVAGLNAKFWMLIVLPEIGETVLVVG